MVEVGEGGGGVGDVRVLALPSVACRRGSLPLLVRGLEQLAVQRETVRGKLMARGTERRPLKRRRADDAVVRKRFARGRGRRRSIAPQRTEALVPPHVARRAGQPGALEFGVECSIGSAAIRVASLLRQRRMT